MRGLHVPPVSSFSQVPGGDGPIVTSHQWTVSTADVCYFRSPQTSLSSPLSTSCGTTATQLQSSITQMRTAPWQTGQRQQPRRTQLPTHRDQVGHHRTATGLPSNWNQCICGPSVTTGNMLRLFIKAISRKASHLQLPLS